MTTAEPDTPESLPSGQRPPIFDFDILCLHCGYNLRGLAEPLCPECGHGFDPQGLVALYKERERQGPPGWRLLWLVYRHPIAFWRMPVLRTVTAPMAAQFVPVGSGLVLSGMCLCLAIITAIPAIWLSIWQSGQEVGELLGAALIFFATGSLGTFILVMGVVGMTIMVHAWLCYLGGKWLGCDASFDLLDRYLNYASAWGVPTAVLLTLGLAIAALGLLPPVNLLLGTLFLLGSCACCLLWAVSLFFGGRKVGGSNRFAVWCTATNPFWCIIVLVAVLVTRMFLR